MTCRKKRHRIITCVEMTVFPPCCPVRELCSVQVFRRSRDESAHLYRSRMLLFDREWINPTTPTPAPAEATEFKPFFWDQRRIGHPEEMKEENSEDLVNQLRYAPAERLLRSAPDEAPFLAFCGVSQLWSWRLCALRISPHLTRLISSFTSVCARLGAS